MNLGSLTVTGNKFRLPCVYEFISSGEVTYVGRSYSGFYRAFAGFKDCGPHGPNGQKRARAFSQADQIRVTVFDSVDEARQEEVRLIRLHNPAANTRLKK